MNKLMQKIWVILFLSLTDQTNAVEERNLLPFYHLTSKPLHIKINPKDYKICRVKLNDVIQNKNAEVNDCYPIDRRFSETIKIIHEKNSKKNELNLMFVDSSKKIINPEFQTTDQVYTIKSILYFKKTKAHHIELMDKDGGYYYFTYDPNTVTVGE